MRAPTPTALLRILTPVGFVAVLSTTQVTNAWAWWLFAASAGFALAFTVTNIVTNPRWPRSAAGLLIASSLFAACAVAPENSATAPSLMCLTLLVLSSLVALTVREILTVAAAVVVVASVGGFVGGHPTSSLVGNALAVLAVLLFGLNRRQHRVQVRQTEQLLEQTQLAQQAVAHGAALEERARIAREIHDIQAHSLSALSLHLQVATKLMVRPDLLTDPAMLGRLSSCVDRAATLAKDGLIETRRAVHALRGDAVALPELLDSLADDAVVRVAGTRRDLPPEATLTLYRTVQEGLTNARKHAPGAPVTVDVSYQDDDVAVTVTNGPATNGPATNDPATSDAPLATTGSGYGLTGLRERAELAGGTLAAGPAETGWRLSVRIPA